MTAQPSHRATAEIDLTALAANYRLLQQAAPNAQIIAVVKANAYGHGVALTVPVLLQGGCRFFAVATLGEAIALRALAPHADILILGYTSPTAARRLARLHLTQTVYSTAYATALSREAARAGVKINVHLKADVGMHRLGFSPEDTAALLAAASLPQLTPTGLFTHFPKADTDPAATQNALHRFLLCRKALQEGGYTLLSHAAASAAALSLPEAHLDAIRPGLALYGISPVPTALPFMPVLRLCAPIVHLARIAAGDEVGYGGDFTATGERVIATLPIGYADGFCREGRGAAVTLCHKNARFSVPVVGRICMDQVMIDVTGTPAAVGDKVVLFSDARTLAAARGTIPYEILTGITARVRRVAAK